MKTIFELEKDNNPALESNFMSIKVYRTPEKELRVNLVDVIEFLKLEAGKKKGVVRLYLLTLIKRLERNLAKIDEKRKIG